MPVCPCKYLLFFFFDFTSNLSANRTKFVEQYLHSAFFVLL
nr:MAG TPA: hypothetical protein [Caudoviricetes sp.]DAG20248.1 MAG TPA: hypothetical protein [Caudoviricetes sp.]